MNYWFDGYKQNRIYALQTLRAAQMVGGEWLVFRHTNGGTLPHNKKLSSFAWFCYV